MCSTANYVLPPSRTCEVLACPSSRVCWGVPAIHLGGRSHGAQHSDMDAAWQELMAITELQGLETCGESSYETKQYQSIEPVASLGMYEAAHCHPEPTPAAFDVGTMDEYYSEEAAGCHRRGTNAASLYEHSGPQLNQRMVSISPDAHQSTAVLTGQMSSPGTSQGDSRPNSSLPRGAGPHMMWTVHGPSSFAHSADDLESDSGLSLGSSPPLASPGNLAAGIPGHRSVDMSVACSDGEPEGMVEHRRARNYPPEYQSQSDSYLQRGAQPSYFTTQHHLSHSHFDAPNPQATNHQTMGELYSAAFSSRGSWLNSTHSKSHGNTQAPASRDERRAIALKIPFPIEKIINLPVDDFNELLTQHTLTDAQLALIKDIRRRGKNKVAAQNCRKRKLDSIIHLERELGQLQVQRDDLVQQRLEFQRSLTYIKCHLTKLYAEVFSHVRDETGQPYSIDEYYLQQMADGQTYLVPHTMHKKEC